MKNGKFDAVFHFAASIIVPESVQNPIKYYYLRITLSKHLNLSNLVWNKINISFFHLLLQCMKAIQKKNLMKTAQIKPSSPYGMSKLTVRI